MRDDRPLIRTRNDLLELTAHALRLQLSKDQALAVADTILRTLKATRLSIGGADNAQIIPAARGSGVIQNVVRAAITQSAHMITSRALSDTLAWTQSGEAGILDMSA